MSENIIYLFIILNIPIICFYDQINLKINIFDKADNIRKLHSQNVPLFGGILILYNFLLFIIIDLKFNLKDEIYFIYTKEYFAFFFGLVSCFVVGLYDDKFNLSAYKKLIFNFIIILIIIMIDDKLVIRELDFSFLNDPIKLDNFAYFYNIMHFTFLNALNMFDGINIQVGLYCVIVFLYFF